LAVNWLVGDAQVIALAYLVYNDQISEGWLVCLLSAVIAVSRVSALLADRRVSDPRADLKRRNHNVKVGRGSRRSLTVR